MKDIGSGLLACTRTFADSLVNNNYE